MAKRLSVSLLVMLPRVALVGCGGIDSYLSRHMGTNDGPVGKTVETTISLYTVAPGGTAAARVVQQGYGGDVTYALAIQEGAAGGTLTPFTDLPNGLGETYTAPAAPGTYHVVGTVTEKGGKVHTDTAIVFVQVAQG